MSPYNVECGVVCYLCWERMTGSDDASANKIQVCKISFPDFGDGQTVGEISSGNEKLEWNISLEEQQTMTELDESSLTISG